MLNLLVLTMLKLDAFGLMVDGGNLGGSRQAMG
jgi:hypothetical protein